MLVIVNKGGMLIKYTALNLYGGLNMIDINQIINDIIRSKNTNELLIAYESDLICGEVNDCNVLYCLASSIVEDEKKDDMWDIILDYVDERIVDDRIFNYLYDNNISLDSLSHLNLEDKFLLKLSDRYDEAFVTLAKRYYNESKYSVLDFLNLLKKCKFENTFMTLFSNEQGITPKGLIIHEVIRKSKLYSKELKDISERVFFAKQLFCTDNIELILSAASLKDYILLVSISQNINTPVCILNELSNISKIKFASIIRQNSLATLKIKKTLI